MFAKEYRYQLLATICVNIMTIGFGTVVGWTSASLLVLQSKADTPLETGPLTAEEISWVSALMCFGGFIGNWVFGWFSSKFGRKIPLIMTAIPLLVGWALIIFAKNPYYLYASRFLSGCSGGGVYVVVPVFVAEISDNKVRGQLGSLFILSLNTGVVIAFILGYLFSYIMSPIILLSIPCLFLLGIFFFPETPLFLMKLGKEEEAERSLRFYRNLSKKSHEEFALLKSEMDKLKVNNQPVVKNGDKKDENVVTWRDFVTPVARKAFLIGLSLLALKQFCGLYALLNYSGTIFAESGTQLNPNLATTIVGIIQLVGTYIPTLLVDRAGRRILLTFSSMGTGIGLVVLGGYIYLKSIGYELEGLSWIPIVSFAFLLFVGNFGIMPLPFIIISEIMPQEIRSVGSSICMGALWLYAFIMFKFFPLLSLALGIYGSIFLFAGFSFTGALFVILVLPETKGKSFAEIKRILGG